MAGVDASELGGMGSVLTGAQAPGGTGASGVASLNGETGAVILESLGGTVAITTPDAQHVNLEVPVPTGRQTLSTIITATTTVVTVTGAAVQDVTFNGLNGDTDGNYECEWYAPNGFGAGSYIGLRPNGDATNTESTGSYQPHATGTAVGQPSGSLAMAVGGTSTATGRFYFASKNGRGNRLFTSEWYDTEGGLTYKYGFAGWYTAAGNITSMVVHHPAAGGIPVGTVFVFRALGEL